MTCRRLGAGLLLAWVAGSAACSGDGGALARDVGRDRGLPRDARAAERGPDAPRPDRSAPDAAAWSCPSYAPASSRGRVKVADIAEASGLAASARNPGVLWLHNDSGDQPRVFAISDKAALLGVFTLQGAQAEDWEDMALGPGPQAGAAYLYLGDIGDNPATRARITVYRVAEPAVSATQRPTQVTLTGVQALPLVYPDGAHNAEALMVDPQSGDLYIVTKTGAAPAGIYVSRAPQQVGVQRTLSKVGTVSPGENVTGGDISGDGAEVLLRTYTRALLWHRAPGQGLGQALAGTPCKVPAALEPQGEAIAFAPGGGDYYTFSEWQNQPLYFYERR